MRLALYHPWVYLRSGVERWMVEVVTRSRHDWTVYTHHHEPEATYPEVAGLDVVQLAPQVSVRRSFGPLVHAAGTLARTRLPSSEGLLVSSEGLGDLVALRSRVPTAAYCHTPLKILHDPAARGVVERQSLARRAALGTIGPAFQAVDRRAWRQYGHVLVNSTETLARVRDAGLRPSGPVEVLEPGVDAAWSTYAPGSPRAPVLLCAGRVMWQKNLELAIDAVRLLGGSARLVIAGMVDEKSRPYLAALRARAAGLPVAFEVAPSDERLRELYATATALLFTPRNEDFGMVVLEAMAAGTPVLAVDAGGPRSTVDHGRTGWLLPPEPEVWAAQLRQVLAAGPRLEAMRPAAVEAARLRTWDAHVTRLDDVMEQLAGRTPGS
ncbi:MAG: glycosyl transferase group 1 [Frankiales bacterium]|nr:glycosyl transferase group 1 [Frankiales bacterium]